MPDEQDDPTQTNDTENDSTVATVDAQDAPQDKGQDLSKAVATSDKFDEKLDAEGYEGDDLEPEPKKAGEAHAAGKTKAKAKAKKTDAGDESPAGDEDAEGPEGKQKAGDEEPPKSAVTDELRKKAYDLGLSEAEVEQFADDAELERTLGILGGIVAESDVQGEPAQDARGPAPGASAPPPAKGAGAEPPKPFELTFEDESQLDPEIVAKFKGMNEHYKGQIEGQKTQIEALSAKVNGLVSNHEQQQARQFLDRFDKMVEKLGDEFTTILGKGATLEMGKRTLAHKNRTAIQRRMYAFAKGLSDAGERLPNDEELFNMAVRSTFGKQVEAVEGLRISKVTSARGRQTLNKAAGTRTSRLTGKEKAVETSKKFDDAIDISED